MNYALSKIQQMEEDDIDAQIEQAGFASILDNRPQP